MPLLVTVIAPPAGLIPLVSGTSLLFLALLGGLAARVGGAGVLEGRPACHVLGCAGHGADRGRRGAVRDGGLGGLPAWGTEHANPARRRSPDLRTEAPSALDDGRARLCDPSRSIWRHELSVKNDWTRRLRLDMLQAALRLERQGEAGGEVLTVDVVDVVDEPSGFAQTRSGGERELTRSLRMRCRRVHRRLVASAGEARSRNAPETGHALDLSRLPLETRDRSSIPMPRPGRSSR